MTEKLTLSAHPTFQAFMKNYDSSASFEARRAFLRNALFAISLETGKPIALEVTFSGYGDSGNFHNDEELPQEIFDFIAENVGSQIPYDWYNNDGGQGSITWDITNDIITINGAINYMESIDQPEVTI